MSDVGIDKNGNAVVVWGENRNCDGFPCDGIWARFRSGAGVWGPAEFISDPTLTDPAYSPAVFMSDSGFATAVWTDSRGIESSNKPLGGHWSVPAVISPGQSISALGGDHAGDVAILINWRTVLLRRADGAWMSAGDAVPASYPYIAAYALPVVSPNGDVVVFWYSYDEHCIGHHCTPFNLALHASRLTPGSSRWQVSNLLPGVDQFTNNYWTSSLATIDSVGAAGIVTSTAKGPVLISQSGPGQPWRAPYLLPTSGSIVGFGSDAAGDATVLATEGTAGQIAVLAGPLTGDAWIRQTTFAESVVSPVPPLLSVSPSGSAAVIFGIGTQNNQGFAIAAATRQSSFASWTAQQEISPRAPEVVEAVGLAAGGPNRAIAAWSNHNVNGSFLTASIHQP